MFDARPYHTLFFLILLLPSAAFPQSADSLLFIQLSDPQFGMYPFGKNFKHERENMAKAVTAINRLRPAFVVITGDLVNRAGDEEQMRAFKESISTVDSTIPVYFAAGNHDVENTPTEQGLERYRREFGADFYAFEVKGSTFIVLNSSLIKDPSRAQHSADKQKQWLESFADSLVTAHRSPLTIIFLHHPFFLDNIEEPSGYGNISKKPRKEYFELIRRLGARYVFAGHMHFNITAAHEGVDVIASGSIGMPLGSDPPGMRLVVVREGRVVHRFVGLDEIAGEGR